MYGAVWVVPGGDTGSPVACDCPWVGVFRLVVLDTQASQVVCSGLGDGWLGCVKWLVMVNLA